MPAPTPTPPNIEISREVNGTPAEAPGDAELAAALEAFLEALGYAGWGLSVRLAGDAAVRELNRAWRGRDAATDVLSWSYLGEPIAAAHGAGEEAPRLLGDLALSMERAEVQAREQGWSLRTEVLRLLAHGCAHLAGYDHETDADARIMRAREIELLERVGLGGLYAGPEDV